MTSANDARNTIITFIQAKKFISFQDESGSWFIDVPLIKFSDGLLYFRREDDKVSRTHYIKDSIVYHNPYN